MSNARAEPWSDGDTVGEVVVGAALAADWLQTRQICRAPLADWHYESNPIMGPTCNRVSADAYFLAVSVGHVVATRAIPWRWARRVFQGATIAVQVDAVRTNFQAGYGFRF